MTNLDMLLLKGGINGMTEENLAELRYSILTRGIPANSEGMVRPYPNRQHPSYRATYTLLHSPSPHAPTLIHHFLTPSSPNSASTSGSSSSTRPLSAPTSTSTSSAKAPPPRTQKSKTTPSVPSKATPSSAAA